MLFIDVNLDKQKMLIGDYFVSQKKILEGHKIRFIAFFNRIFNEYRLKKNMLIYGNFTMFSQCECQNSSRFMRFSLCRNKFQSYNGYLALVNNRIIYSICQVPIQYVYLCIEYPIQAYFTELLPIYIAKNIFLYS